MTEITGWNQGELLQNHEKVPIGELPRNREEYLFTRYKYYRQQSLLPTQHPTDYLQSIEPYIPEALISRLNFTEIKNLANFFTGGITSFFGFESRLNSSDARSDYLFAISARKGEREALVNLLQNKYFRESFLQQSEWQHMKEFVMTWADPKSILNNKVVGLWFEFDTADSSAKTPIPCIFLSTVPLRIDTIEDLPKCAWLTDMALPLLTGQRLTENLEHQLLEALQQLPGGATVMNVGVMLARSATGIRLVITRIQPGDILPYLEAIGWSDDIEAVSSLVEDLEQYVSRLVLHINIREDGVDPKIGIECSFSPDQYNLEHGWSEFLDYLITKGLCLPEKKNALLHFPGVIQEETTQKFDPTTYQIAVKIHDTEFSPALVRYISHIKIVHKPGQSLEAKAYPGVRLFGLPRKNLWQPVETIQ